MHINRLLAGMAGVTLTTLVLLVLQLEASLSAISV